MTADVGELVASTKFSSINKLGAYAYKNTLVETVVKPHDPMCELAILKKLQDPGSPYVIELVSSKVSQGVVTLGFPYYKQNMYEYMRAQYQKRRWNPYLLATQEQSTLQLSNKLDANLAVEYFRQLAHALAYIHSKKVIHRDIKLQNVMVDTEAGDNAPHLVLIDFGISYDLDNPQEPADAKITDVSTSIYKAPELLFSVKNYTYAVDIWALLVLVSQLLQSNSTSERYVPAFVEDGSEGSNLGSDIRLISSIFEQLGTPTLEQWPEVRDRGSPAFAGMFGTSGDGRYVLNRSKPECFDACMRLFPKLEELSEPIRSSVIECLLRMMPFESTERATASELVDLLAECQT
ncbi:cyclin-dependent protein kinase-activating kinase CAK1 [Lachancea thermotolerans CBS 6340]|uniref:KLTH0G18282p n=1 Tax=Lachancea thermotolerans (strain ATCC 56472 / CBS 6340 / NRRL Y-8284) TaxID=559295 RepID=C5DNM2_LACTC|nr:KLTH0G18282p [Lachancea thermotolerans CBS 6340]CAR25383.1 KLTH0G18282p [Lachancea thermotolerans CBS 6340]